jgi:signal peptidase I
VQKKEKSAIVSICMKSIDPILAQPAEANQAKVATPTPSPVIDPPTPLISQNGRRPKRDANSKRNIISTVAIIIIAPIIALCLTAFVFQSYEVDGVSMESTLQNNDRLIVYKLPKTLSKLTDHPYIPHRGDIIVFVEKGLDSSDPAESKQLIKRVIALPGDHLVIANDVVTIYNQQHPNGFDPDKALPYGKILPVTTGSVNLTVPANQIFVMGDNRTDSLDSRVFGTVPVQNIIGKLVLRVLPLDKAQSF